MFVGDFNSKLESFGCTKKNTSGSVLRNIQKQLNLIYLNNDGHTHETLVMPAGPRLALSEFSVFTYTKLENSD